MGKQTPIIAELDGVAAEHAHQQWFHDRVEASLADGRPTVPHRAVMDELDEVIAQAERRSTS